MNLLHDEEFLRLEKDFKFLSNARNYYKNTKNELENLQYVIVDIETTGLNPETEEIIEIGAFKTQGIVAKDVFNTLIKPKKNIPLEAEKIHGISNEMVADKQYIEVVLPSFIDFVGNSVLVAHNADFDIGFIRHHLNQALGRTMDNDSLCTVKLARLIFPNLSNHKLPTVANHLNIDIHSHHRALSDAEATYHIWAKFIELLKEKNINTLKEIKSLIK